MEESRESADMAVKKQTLVNVCRAVAMALLHVPAALMTSKLTTKTAKGRKLEWTEA